MARQVSRARIGQLIGAEKSFQTFLFTLFVPSRDRYGHLIDHDRWWEDAVKEFTERFGGATAFQHTYGGWRNPDPQLGEERVLYERVTVVQCWARQEDITEENFQHLRAFLHRLGRETEQGEVGIVINGVYHPIRSFDRDATQSDEP